MKHSFNDELTKELMKLDQSIQLSSGQKEKMRRHIFSVQPKKSCQSHRWLPIVLSVVVIISVVFSVFSLIENETKISLGDTSSITDHLTPEQLSSVSQSENTFLIDWEIDSMDRGSHEFNTFVHGQLVVTPDFNDLQRGQVVYYHTPPEAITSSPSTPEKYIGRVVGLPGETVEIKNGQVYIDARQLNTFYGIASMHGLNEEEYFKNVQSKNIANEQLTRDYFNTNTNPVTVKENTVFILVDQWWRGIDSRDYGPLPIEKIEGIVIGYKE